MRRPRLHPTLRFNLLAITLAACLLNCAHRPPERRPDPVPQTTARAELEAAREREARRMAEREERRMAERSDMSRRQEAARSTPPPPPPPPRPTPVEANPNVAADQGFARVTVLYGTDRKMDPATAQFGGDRGSGISYGEVVVSVPHGHRTGELEAPSVWRLEFSENPRKHMAVLDRAYMTRTAFMNRVKARLKAQGPDASSFVFVHGYNVSFDDAARRTAQITYDLDYRGIPVFYSWPSQGTLQGYTTDETNVLWSEGNLKRFLADHAHASEGKDIYLIAHSMGNRALTGALRQLFTEQPRLKGRFKEIILTAPDIDADTFKRDIAPALAAGCKRITLYVSSGDNALLASKKVHGYPRAGDTASGIVIAPGIETIDASGLDTSFLEHSYFATAPPVLSDIRRVLREGLRAASRGLESRLAGGGSYWKLKGPSHP